MGATSHSVSSPEAVQHVAQASGKAPDSQAVRDTILRLLAEKTGYPQDMLDTDLDLEADLGIDTVKQAEFISEVREAFNIPRIEGLKIADFPTIEHIIGFVLEQTDSAPPLSASQGGTVDDGEVRGKILAMLSAKTGYPQELLDTDLDLEADLGIDTVKQAEFISEVRETFNIPRIEGLKIADFPTIEQIIGFVLEQTAHASGKESARMHVEPELTPAPAKNEWPSLVEDIVPAAPIAQSASSLTVDEETIKVRVLELLSGKTGYPAEMLDLDADLEADLGIDTVKQAEFISEVREEFGIPRIDGLKIADFPTIQHIIGFVVENAAEAPAGTAPTGDHPPVPEEAESLQAGRAIALFETRLLPVPALEATARPDVDEVILIGGNVELASQVESSLKALGYSVAQMEQLTDAKELPEKKVGIVNLTPLENGDPTRTFELYITLAQTFETGPVFLITVVSDDGALGFDQPSDTTHLAGVIIGATKSFGREFPQTRTTVMDVTPLAGAVGDRRSGCPESYRGRPNGVRCGSGQLSAGGAAGTHRGFGRSRLRNRRRGPGDRRR